MESYPRKLSPYKFRNSVKNRKTVFFFVCLFFGFFFFTIVNTLASGVATGKFNVILIPRLFSVTFFLLQKILESFYPRYNETSRLG